MLRPKIAVLVSGGGTNLQALLDAARAGALSSGDIALVVSSRPGVYALERARAAGVPAVVVKRKGRSAGDFERELLDALAAHGIDLVVLAGFLCILSPDFIARYEGRIVNVHPSLLPAFGGRGFYGLAVHEAALARGVKVTGATVHLVNEIDIRIGREDPAAARRGGARGRHARDPSAPRDGAGGVDLAAPGRAGPV